MKGASKRILFFCTHRSPRALMAASLLTTRARHPWDIWSTPITTSAQDIDLVRQVLDEIHVPLLLAPQTTEPLFDLDWDEGIVLCSGAVDQWPFIPNAGRRHVWSVENEPLAEQTEEERLQIYRRIQVTLIHYINMNLLLPTMLAMVPQHK